MTYRVYLTSTFATLRGGFQSWSAAIAWAGWLYTDGTVHVTPENA